MYFFLVQSEQGDIFKITLDTDDDTVCVLHVCLCVSTLWFVLSGGSYQNQIF